MDTPDTVYKFSEGKGVKSSFLKPDRRKKVEKKLKKWNRTYCIPFRLRVKYACCMFRDEAVSCRQARRVIIADQPHNRTTDSKAPKYLHLQWIH